MKLHSFSTFIKDAFHNIILNKLMSVATIFTLAAGIFLFGITTALTVNVFSITGKLEKDFKLAVYLEDELEQKDINKIGVSIQEIENVESTEFVTKEAAFSELKEQFGDTDLLEGLDGGDILRSSYKITLSDLNASSEVTKELEKIKGVAKVTKLDDEMAKFKEMTTKAQIGTVAISVILALLAVLIIINTINMSIFARRKEISIMKYVGATDWYIRWPFIFEGLLIGAISSAFAYTGTYFLYKSFVNTMGSYSELIGVLSLNDAMGPVSFAVIGLGLALGCLGSIVAIKKYLKV